MVLAASVAMAQTNQSAINQADGSQTATVDQQGGDNTSTVTQSNAANIATVTQINYLLMEDEANDVTISNVTQSGKRNEATVSQTHSRQGAYPDDGGPIEAVVNQSGNDNVSEQIQGPHNQIGSSFASVVQSGNNNDAYQIQVRWGNDAYIVQSGNGNAARQAQDTELPDDVVGSENYALINQSGNSNLADQEQHGWDNSVIATQSGHGNISTQLQDNSSFMSEATVLQAGSNNMADQYQLGSLNIGKIEQHSNGNEAYQSQTADARRDPWVSQEVTWAPLNNAEIYQLGGNGNVARQTQTTPGGTNDIELNDASIWQNGSNNFAEQAQWGGFNTSTISQTGSGHVANLTQSQSVVQ